MSKTPKLNDATIVIVIIAINYSNQIELPKHNMARFTIDVLSYLAYCKSNSNNKVKLISYR